MLTCSLKSNVLLNRFHLHFIQIPEQDRQGDLENMDQGERFWQQTIFFWD